MTKAEPQKTMKSFVTVTPTLWVLSFQPKRLWLYAIKQFVKSNDSNLATVKLKRG